MSSIRGQASSRLRFHVQHHLSKILHSYLQSTLTIHAHHCNSNPIHKLLAYVQQLLILHCNYYYFHLTLLAHPKFPIDFHVQRLTSPWNVDSIESEQFLSQQIEMHGLAFHQVILNPIYIHSHQRHRKLGDLDLKVTRQYHSQILRGLEMLLLKGLIVVPSSISIYLN